MSVPPPREDDPGNGDGAGEGGEAVDFSVIVPAYDEVSNMDALFRELGDALPGLPWSGEILLVDDGSSDGTLEAARSAASDAGLAAVTSFHRHRQNRGKTEALLTGARHARGEILVLFDADLQHSPSEIPRFLQELEKGFDVVTGRKVGDYQKQMVSTIYNWLCRKIFRVPVHDLNAMKAFRREILDELHLRKDWHRYLVVLAHARGYRVGEIDIELFPRRHGRSKYRGQGRILVGILDLLAVWFQLVFSRKPMLFFGMTGLFVLVLGGAVGGAALYMRFVLGQGYRPLLSLIVLLIVGGLILFVVGFLAELIAGLRNEIEALRREIES